MMGWVLFSPPTPLIIVGGGGGGVMGDPTSLFGYEDVTIPVLRLVERMRMDGDFHPVNHR
jgi:hypothetical protein